MSTRSPQRLTGALALLWALSPAVAAAAPNHVSVLSDDDGYKLQIDGQDTFVRGMNWGYVPIGTNYSYDFWGQPEDFIRAALTEEMGLLTAMGVNSIRQYPGIPPEWVTWIYENYGITTMINPLVGRYGINVNGAWVPVVDYSNPAHREVIKAETMAAIERYRDVEGVLVWLLGNENNYGLSWKSFEIEALPEGERQVARARHLYSLMGELVDAIHAIDSHHPVVLCNGDLQYIDLIAELAPNLDIMGSNVYRGISSRDLFDRVGDELGLPLLYTEFGSDAYNARTGREDGLAQATYLHGQWQEIYEHTHGKGRSGTAIGGYVFQWSDGWWKYLQEENLDVHDTNANWPNAGYPHDYVEGQNNMNEEWFGITAKGPTRADGSFSVVPRHAYYLLRDAWSLDPYAPDTSIASIEAHYRDIQPSDYNGLAQAGLTKLQVDQLSRVRLSELRLEMSSFVSERPQGYLEGTGSPTFDHMESFWLGAEATPTKDVRADLRLSVLGHVPENRIDHLYWEAAGAPRYVQGAEDLDGTEVDVAALDRVRIHDAGFAWEHSSFTLKGYYRQGHFHWGHKGDFFGLYREAFYGPNPDWYHSDVPIGLEWTGKKALAPFAVALGPQIYWGANPTVIAKAREQVGPVTVSVMHQEDVAQQAVATTSSAIPEPVSRRSTLVIETGSNGLGLTLGGIFAGSNKLGQSYLKAQPSAGGDSYAGSGMDVLEDEIQWIDTLGFRAKLAGGVGPINAYVQGGIQGLVADGGPDPVYNFTGWNLKQSGRGNQRAVVGGLAWTPGAVQIAPSVLWQKPLVGPNPVIDQTIDAETGWYTPRVVPRNVMDDPFVVRENRETTAFELLLVYDPTPGSWMWQWDNFVREDAGFSAALDFVYRFQPTSTDSHIGFTEDGILFSYDEAPPAQDVFDITGHVHLRPRGDMQLRLTGYGGTKQASGSDPRLVTAYGGGVTGWWRTLALETTLKVDDWGPYDYHRDFNLTYPLQLVGDLSGGLARPNLDKSQPRLGIRGQVRTLDEHSPDYLGLSGASGEQDLEWEVGTYAFIGI